MIEGCKSWRTERLAPPAAVCTATDDYLQAEDALATWIAERCKTIGYGCTETDVLFKDWKAWAIATGEEPGSMKRFSQAMEGKGHRKVRDPSSDRSAFAGVALKVQRPWTETVDEQV
jgi:putative DNA primase/helicase